MKAEEGNQSNFHKILTASEFIKLWTRDRQVREGQGLDLLDRDDIELINIFHQL